MRELSRSAITRVSGGQTGDGMAIAGGIGGGVVASHIIETVGGGSISGLVEKVGVAALPVGVAAAVGILSAGAAGYAAGSWVSDYYERYYGPSAGFPRTSDGQMAFDP
jgi:hypothetical protein